MKTIMMVILGVLLGCNVLAVIIFMIQNNAGGVLYLNVLGCVLFGFFLAKEGGR